jgi:hypothetical protein
MTASAKTFGACCGRAWPAFGTRWWIRLPENLAPEDRPSEAGMMPLASPSSLTVGVVMTGSAASLRIAGCQSKAMPIGVDHHVNVVRIVE